MDNLKEKLVSRGFASLSNSLSIKNPLFTDENIFFKQEYHKMAVLEEGKIIYPKNSVTRQVKKCFNPFDGDKISLKMALKEGLTGLGAKSRAKEIQDTWKESARLGTLLHDCIDDYYTNEGKKESKMKDTIEWKQFLEFDKFIKAKGWEPFRSEVALWAKEINLTGIVDMIFYDPKLKEYHLYDWKRSKMVWAKGYEGKKGLFNYSDVNDCNYVHYSMQLQLYETILKKVYNLTMKTKCIVVFHESNSKNSFYYKKHYVCPVEDSYKIIDCKNFWKLL